MRPVERTILRVGTALLCAALLWGAQPALAQFTQQVELFGSGAIGTAEQGKSVALAGDGNTAIVGGWCDNPVNICSVAGGAGAAWVFTRSGGTWSQQAKLFGSGAVGMSTDQGWSVALSADGNTAIVGGPGDNNDAGAAWVFIRSGGTWSQQAKLVGTGAVGSNARQGWSVALSGDGNTAIVGAPNDNSGAGAVWVFTRAGGTWSKQGNKLVGSGAVGTIVSQGVSVALSGDGNTAIVGGQGDSLSAGAAWIFIRCPGPGWCQQAKLVGSGAVGSTEQGFSVALSGDGNTAVVGGPFDDFGTGAAWVFTRSDGLWSQQGNKLIGNGAVGAAKQGFSVALSGGGNIAIMGAYADNSDAGAAWVFTRSGGSWSQLGNKLMGNGAIGAAKQGTSVALSCNTAVVGGPENNSNAGAAWVFVAPPTATHDFNGDCNSDILLYNATSGEAAIWLMNGASVIGAGSPGSAGSPWAIVGQRDFNGDGMSDVLWRNGTTGQAVVWLLNGSTVIGGGSPGSAASPWTIAGTGDFNGDGFGDILWYNTSSGQVVLWFLNGATVIGGGSLGSVPSPWIIAGTGDFNGDGLSDILWYNTSTGQVVLWFLNGTTVLPTSGSPGSAASPWTIAGTGDFNGDGKSDILWYNTSTGQVVLWLLIGTTVLPSSGSPGSAPSPWTIAATGDFNGDYVSDILWYNTSRGQAVIWLLSGASVIGGGSPGSAPSPWLIQGMNAD
jgi:hypothetical protein